MKLLLVSLCVLAGAWLLHVIVWRHRVPRNQTAALLRIFFAGWLAGLALVWFAFLGTSPAYAALHFTLFHVPLSLAYISFFSLIEHDSPSLGMVALAARSGESGCTREDIRRLLGGNEIISQRLDAAAGNGLIVRRDARWFLTERGRRIARVLALADRLFRIEGTG